MRYVLKDYQDDAVGRMLRNFEDAHDDFHRRERNVAFSLAATTGAGKTVMAAAVVEALFFGNDDHNFVADPGAVVLWFTDSPTLNTQTRHRLADAGDMLAPHMTTIENTFNQEKFEPGRVYFLNRQKIEPGRILVRGSIYDDGDFLDGTATPDTRSFTLWDTIKNTIEDQTLTLYVILDEAHRGMGSTRTEDEQRTTVARRLINGHGGVPPIPVVWGISATIERFTTAMAGIENRTTYPNFEIDPAVIQESGLLKDTISLDIPDEAGQFDTVLLRRGTRHLKEATEAWAAYAASQTPPEKPVAPLMVVQMPNRPTADLLQSAVDTVLDEWPALRAENFANVFGEHSDIEVGSLSIPYIEPDTVQEATHVTILFAKDAISTGWDCPRAEVLVSFRASRERVQITQLLGRMVRTPLARRVPGNERLNTVDCILPHFDERTATEVADILQGRKNEGEDGRGGSGGGTGRKVVYGPESFKPRESLPDSLWDLFEALPSQSLPRKAASPTKRLLSLGQALAQDRLKPGARREALKELFKVLDGLAARFKTELDEARAQVLQVDGKTLQSTRGTGVKLAGRFYEQADETSLAADYKLAQRAFTPDVAAGYADYIAVADDDDDGLFDAQLTVAALATIPTVADELNRAAGELADGWYTEHRAAIRHLSDERQGVYATIRAMSTDPTPTDVRKPKNRVEGTKDAAGTALRTRPKHLLADSDGNFPVGDLSPAELKVVDTELGRENVNVVGWYRNAERGGTDSLAVPYKDGTGTWRRMFPDFIFFTGSETDIQVSIVDPHGFQLGDALPKLRGMCDFVEEFGDTFVRVDALSPMRDNSIRVLDLRDSKVRDAVRIAEDAEALYKSPVATDYR